MYQMPRTPFDKLPTAGGERGICVPNLRHYTNVTHTGSMVASNQGDVRISAGDTLNVKGSDIQAH